jgi:hypothetical protein
MVRAIIWLYSLMATIIFSLLGLALLVSSAFGHAFINSGAVEQIVRAYLARHAGY